MIEKIIERLRSTKFWAGVILYPAFVILNRKAKLGLTDTDLWTIVAGVIAWIYAQGSKDAAGAAVKPEDVAAAAGKALDIILEKSTGPTNGAGPAPEMK